MSKRSDEIFDYRSTGLPRDPDPVDTGAELVRWLFPAYIFLMLAGFFVLRTSLVMPSGNELNHDRAIFTSINAATLTGFQLSIHPSQFSTFGKVVLLVLTVAGTLFSLTVGGLAVKRVLRLAWPDSRLIGAIFVIQILVLIIGAIARTGSDRSTIGGMVQACAAWGNSGLYVSVPPVATDLFTHVVLLPLALLGGLGITVVIEVFDALMYRRPISQHAKTVLHVTAALYLIGLAGFTILQLMGIEAISHSKAGTWAKAVGQHWPQIATNASIAALDTRTAGMDLLPFYSLPRSMAFFAIVMMAIGASPGGTGGGLKTTTLWTLVTAPLRALRGQPLSRTFGIAATWFGLYLGVMLLLHLLLLWAEPQMPGDRLLFVTVSALSNVGLSHDHLSMTRASLLLVSAGMLFGRLAPLLILWWMADTTRDTEIAVG